jgi:hypothetical protein
MWCLVYVNDKHGNSEFPVCCENDAKTTNTAAAGSRRRAAIVSPPLRPQPLNGIGSYIPRKYRLLCSALKCQWTSPRNDNRSIDSVTRCAECKVYKIGIGIGRNSFPFLGRYTSYRRSFLLRRFRYYCPHSTADTFIASFLRSGNKVLNLCSSNHVDINDGALFPSGDSSRLLLAPPKPERRLLSRPRC